MLLIGCLAGEGWLVTPPATMSTGVQPLLLAENQGWKLRSGAVGLFEFLLIRLPLACYLEYFALLGALSVYGDLGDLPPYGVLHAGADVVRGTSLLLAQNEDVKPSSFTSSRDPITASMP
jgi:hypothetical protein